MKIRVKIDDEIYEVEVGDLIARPILATIHGETFEVFPEEPESGFPDASPRPPAVVTAPLTTPAQRQIPSAPSSATVVSRTKIVTAPIPGVIISISVKVGDTVSFGQELCKLEAMKMKNVIRAARAGTIAVVYIAVGQTVSHGQALFEYSD